jgi:hypothetical protein
VLGNYVVIEETANTPNLKVGAGVQGIGTGNPGYFATTEKNFQWAEGTLNVYAGIAYRANEDHGHMVGGVKLDPHGPWAIGLQLDGHQGNPYMTHSFDRFVVGFYLVGYEKPGYLLGVRF